MQHLVKVYPEYNPVSRVGVVLCVISLLYYMRPLYDGVGGNAIWAVMTVVVVFEYTIGATLYKSLNRICATCLAGFLAIGVHWVASQSGIKFEPLILGASVFLLASGVTFSRFIPVVKARFDYGVTIFILTFSLVYVSGYRVEKLLDMAHERLATIIIGTALCMVTTMVVYPIWAGEELHFLIIRNMDKVSDSLDCCVADYFKADEANPNSDEACSKNLEAYKSALNSKGSEDAMANFARWEPAHGLFSFNHPWKQYLKVSAALRNCAYCIEALNSCLYLVSTIHGNSPSRWKDQQLLQLQSRSSDFTLDITNTKSIPSKITLGMCMWLGGHVNISE